MFQKKVKKVAEYWKWWNGFQLWIIVSQCYGPQKYIGRGIEGSENKSFKQGSIDWNIVKGGNADS